MNSKSTIEVAGGYIVHQGKMLLLKRQDHKNQGNRWGLPGGKLDFLVGDDRWETPSEAFIRETQEETSLKLNDILLESLGFVDVIHDGNNYKYHSFGYNDSSWENFPKIQISEAEHKDYGWFTPSETDNIDLVQDTAEHIRDNIHLF